MTEARQLIATLSNQNSIHCQFIRKLCDTHPSAITKMLEEQVKRICELEHELDAKADMINALVAQNRAALDKKDLEIGNWKRVVTQRHGDKVVVSPAYLGHPR